jgi:hypothetical protein
MIANGSVRPRLTHLRAAASAISDDFVLSLRRATALESLDFSECPRLAGLALAGLAALPHLHSLTLFGCDGLSAPACAAIGRVRSLQLLVLAYCRGVGDDGVAALTMLPALSSLDLSRTQVGDGACCDVV